MKIMSLPPSSSPGAAITAFARKVHICCCAATCCNFFSMEVLGIRVGLVNQKLKLALDHMELPVRES